MLATPERALVVIPHPDDAEGGCGGTIAKWTSQGAQVFFVLCTDGGKGSSDPEMTPERLVAIREKEQLDAATVLGVKEVVLLRHPDGELEDTREFRREIVRAIRHFRPGVVLCTDHVRRNTHTHRDHRITGQVTVDAVFPYARDRLHFPELLKEERLEPHKTGIVLFWQSEEPNVYVDITDVIETKIKALLCHKSQMLRPGRNIEDVKRRIIKGAEETGKTAGFKYAEAFRKIEFSR